ncbi:DoxX family protein [Pseudopedobacter beijingensis]|uniref:DoxX family protein n=1 Tax=Pseudopedobacter beijingensis TaxID=1207056 RepID=A0ABW4IB01_9SPHI
MSSSSQKTAKIIYWVTTILLALFILPGIFFLNSPMALEGVRHLGIPEWLRYEVGIGSFIGGLIILLPVWSRLKEWAYVALGIVYISAFIGHLSIDGLQAVTFQALLMLVILLLSYCYWHKLNTPR